MTTTLLISTYELGHQPFGLASPAAWLRRAGVDVTCLDLSRQSLPASLVERSQLVAFYLPMHTATRLAVPVIERVRRANPDARLVAYGLYAPPNRSLLGAAGIEVVLGPECEAELVELATGRMSEGAGGAQPANLPRLQLIQPDRSGLPPLGKYASIVLADGTQRIAGYTEATRGCKHVCRHCPIVPIYNGRFRVVAADVVLADIRVQVESGAEHITFGDPDFLNGPRHARRIVEGIHSEWPSLTFDVVVKIEHVLRHPDLIGVLATCGCLFVTSAVESFDDLVLDRLQKGHTRADVARAVALLRAIGLPLVPTFVAFTPWTTVATYVEMLEAIAALDLVEHVAPIQLAIRLLVPNGSRLLDLPEIRAIARRFDPASLAFEWAHPDPAVDDLQRRVMALVAQATTASRGEVFARVRRLACEVAGVEGREDPPRADRATIPYLNEPWYC